MNQISSREALFNKNMPKKQRHQPENQRVLRFADWMDSNGGKWYAPDLTPFVEYLANLNVDIDEIEAHIKSITSTYVNVVEDKHLLISGVASSMTNNKDEWSEKIKEIKATLLSFSKSGFKDIDVEGIVKEVRLSKEKKSKRKFELKKAGVNVRDNISANDTNPHDNNIGPIVVAVSSDNPIDKVKEAIEHIEEQIKSDKTD